MFLIFNFIFYRCCTFRTVQILGLFTFSAMNILSALLLIPISNFPITNTPTTDLVQLNVIVGEVVGSLTLKTLGYCLKVSDQNICSSARPAYAISKFFSNHRIK